MSKEKRIDSVKIVTVIEVKALRGEGTASDPCRIVIQYWSFGGVLLAENDPAIEQKRGNHRC